MMAQPTLVTLGVLTSPTYTTTPWLCCKRARSGLPRRSSSGTCKSSDLSPSLDTDNTTLLGSSLGTERTKTRSQRPAVKIGSRNSKKNSKRGKVSQRPAPPRTGPRMGARPGLPHAANPHPMAVRTELRQTTPDPGPVVAEQCRVRKVCYLPTVYTKLDLISLSNTAPSSNSSRATSRSKGMQFLGSYIYEPRSDTVIRHSSPFFGIKKEKDRS